MPRSFKCIFGDVTRCHGYGSTVSLSGVGSDRRGGGGWGGPSGNVPLWGPQGVLGPRDGLAVALGHDGSSGVANELEEGLSEVPRESEVDVESYGEISHFEDVGDCSEQLRNVERQKKSLKVIKFIGEGQLTLLIK